MRRRVGVIIVASGATAACLFADFSYQQSTKMTGGAMAAMMNMAGAYSKQAREPNTSTVAVKGDRMVHVSARQATITDLEKETITTVHFDQKTYSVRTFEQMKQMMEQVSQKKADGNSHVSMKDTGQRKKVAGFDTHEVVMTLEMESSKGSTTVTSDMWLAPKMAGYEEVRNFHRRMAQKLNWTPGGGMPMMGRPEMASGMAEIMKESAKLDGVPVLQITKMGGSANAMRGGAERARAGRGKSSTDQEDPSAAMAAPGGGDGSYLMEITTELTGFSSAPVDASKFEVPADFTQVEPQTMPRRRR